MEKFNLYGEAFIFISLFALFILVPCYFIITIGRSMMDEIGRFPTKTAFIQVTAVLQLLGIEVITFLSLIAFFNRFSG